MSLIFKPHIEQYSVIDPVQSSLDEEIIFNDKVRPEIRAKILSAVDEISKVLKIEIQKVWALGSSFTYQYTPESDIDIMLVINKHKEELIELNKLADTQFNAKLFVNKHPVNFHFNYGKYFKFKADAIYDLKLDKWIKKPESLTDSDIQELVKGCESAKEFNEILQEYSKLKHLLDSYTNNPQQVKEILEQTLKVSYLFDKIRDTRREEFRKRKTDDIPSANFRCSNIIFKLLESYGLNNLAAEISNFFTQRFKT